MKFDACRLQHGPTHANVLCMGVDHQGQAASPSMAPSSLKYSRRIVTCSTKKGNIQIWVEVWTVAMTQMNIQDAPVCKTAANALGYQLFHASSHPAGCVPQWPGPHYLVQMNVSGRGQRLSASNLPAAS